MAQVAALLRSSRYKKNPHCRTVRVSFAAKPGSLTLAQFFADLLDGAQLSNRFSQLSQRQGVIHLATLVFHRQFGLTLGFQSCSLIDVVSTDSGVSQDGDSVRLHFQLAARDVNALCCTALSYNTDGTRDQRGQQCCVTGFNTQFTLCTTGYHTLDQTGEQILFGADDIAMDGNRHNLSLRLRRPATLLLRSCRPGQVTFSWLSQRLRRWCQPCRTLVPAGCRTRRSGYPGNHGWFLSATRTYQVHR